MFRTASNAGLQLSQHIANSDLREEHPMLYKKIKLYRPAGRCLQLVRPIMGEGLSERGFTCGDLVPGKKFHYRHREVRSAAI